MADSIPEPEAVLTPKEDAKALKTAGQRKINLLWEITQCYIATMVCTTGMGCMVYLAMSNGSETKNLTQIAAISTINIMIGSVIGFYFGRTNHTRTGGVGTIESDNTR